MGDRKAERTQQDASAGSADPASEPAQ
jgi:hypothetical protein